MKAFQLTTRGRLVSIIGAILTIGFVAVNFANYRVSSQSVREALINNELPLTSNNIYSEIQAGLLRPIYISSLMANDTFLKDWMLEGERNLEKVTKYLDEIRKRYDVSATFVVSDRTHRYYHYQGILKTVSPSTPKDSWFFSMASHPESYRVDVDYNEARQNTLTIFVNHKLEDYEGRFIGVTGLGLDIVSVAAMIERYRDEFERNIYFVDRAGMIKSHHDQDLIDRRNIHDQPGIDQVADQVLSGNSGFLIYPREHDQVLLSYRFIPELDWFLLVEQPESRALKPIRDALYINLAVGAAITVIVLLISGYTINLFQTRLEKLARTDKLTGLMNRQYFDAIFSHAIRRMERNPTAPLSLAIFDLDNLKLINDRYGHLEGDRAIGTVARIAQSKVRSSDVISRWGGDEFTVLFPDCAASDAERIMEAIQDEVAAELDFPEDLQVGISAGVAEYRRGDDPASLLARADEQLYVAKRASKSRLPAEPAASAKAGGPGR